MNVYEAVIRLNDAQRRWLVGELGKLGAFVNQSTPSDVGIAVRTFADQGDENRRRIEGLLREVCGEKGPLDVVIVAVEEEFGEEVGKLKELLHQRPMQVRSVRVARPGEAEGGHAIVLLGSAIDGAEGAARVKRLLDEGALGLKRWPPSPEAFARYAAELGHSAPLLPRCEELANLRPAVVAWLDRLVPRKGAALAAWEENYLRRSLPGWIRGVHSALVNRADRTPLRRAELYVPLPVELGAAWKDEGGRVRFDSPARWDVWSRRILRPHSPEEALEMEEEGRLRPARADSQPAFVDEVVSLPDERLCLLLGEAGSGKTVTALHLAAAWAAPHLGGLDPEDAAGLAAVEARAKLQQPPRALPLIPLFVEARRLTSAEALLKDLPGFEGQAHELLKQDRYVFIVDSLDEVPTVARRRELLRELATLAREGTRVVLTSRPGAHTRVDVPKAWRVLPIAGLDKDTRGQMLERWAEAQGYDADRRRELTEAVGSLSSRFQDGDRALADNPLLLTCIFLVFQEGRGRLPDNAADLYRRMVDILCETRAALQVDGRAHADDPEGRRADSPQVRFTHAAAIAWLLQQRGTAAPLDLLAAALQAEASLGFADVQAARQRIEQIVATTAIFRTVEEAGVIQVRPWHRSFQEYLAAARLARQDGEVKVRLAAVSGRVGDPSWRGCLGFVIGALGQVQPEHAQTAVREWLALRDTNPKVAGARLALLAEAVAEYRPESFDGQGALLDELSRVALARYAVDGADWGWRDRVAMLEALGRLGLDRRWPDPTKDPGGWVRVPVYPGKVGGEGVQALPSRTVEVPPRWVLGRPVTVGDYARFVDEGGYEDPRWWEGGRMPLDEGFPRQRRWPNRPVVGVSWFEAVAFCRWATTRWSLPGEGVVDLPTSTEWEVTARAGGGGVFPWGDEVQEGDAAEANFAWDRDSPGRPTATGAFPRGVVRVPGGVLQDVAGNAWEWTRTEWLSGEERDVAGLTIVTGAPRVLRGGSCLGLSGDLRCAAREWNHPEFRYSYVGFRVVFRPSSPLGS